MDFEISHEHSLLRETVRRFVREQLKPHEKSVDETDKLDSGLMLELRQEAVRLGIYAHNLPERLGGGELDALGQVILVQEAGHTMIALTESMGFLPEILTCAVEAQREWLLDPLVRAEKTICYGLTEADAGSDLSRLRSSAERIKGKWILNGNKDFISNADIADFIVVLMVTDPAAPLKSRFTSFVIERDNPGFKLLRVFRAMGWHGSHLTSFALDNCVLEDRNILGKVGGGFEAVMKTVNSARMRVSARCVGMAEELYSLAREHVHQRVTFGLRLKEHQAIQFKIADIDLEIEAARMLTYKTAWLVERKHPEARIAASRSKLYSSEMVGRVSDSVLQMFGAAGYVADLPIERFYRDARAYRIGEGTSEMQRIQIARQALQ